LTTLDVSAPLRGEARAELEAHVETQLYTLNSSLLVEASGLALPEIGGCADVTCDDAASQGKAGQCCSRRDLPCGYLDGA
jgi:hypothetical protein